MQAGGGTATNDAIAVAMKMIEDQRKIDPDLKPMIFLLSDGKQNRGHSLEDIRGIVKGLGVPVNTIGYNEDADSQVLQEIASINEAVYTNSDSRDVVDTLSNMFNTKL